ncbi:hypothetical protein CC78DRAFT_585044 [Lojkania enalia]|uniref:Uncharacterized protein n=1 Tax=Lojkania enalia TaxID=147567 RepID=A0A9P4K0C1_9PLEO|nr:hypothetical protein CC78DRAFT_585044 [Didymosphaeria enalia]
MRHTCPSLRSHLKLMGATYIEAYPDLWPNVKPFFDQVCQTGAGVEFAAEALGRPPYHHPQSTGLSSTARARGHLHPPHGDAGTNLNNIPLAILYELDDSGSSTIMRMRRHTGLSEDHGLLVPDSRRAGFNILDIDRDDISTLWLGGDLGYLRQRLPFYPSRAAPTSLVILLYLVHGIEHCVDNIDAEQAKKRQQQLENDFAFSNFKWRHLIKHASVAMAHLPLEGEDEDRPKGEEVWESFVGEAHHITTELRLKRLYTSLVGDAEPAKNPSSSIPLPGGWQSEVHHGLYNRHQQVKMDTVISGMARIGGLRSQ